MVSSDYSQSLLVAGGNSDPNLAELVAAAEQASIPVHDLRHGLKDSPPLSWQLNDSLLKVSNQSIKPDGSFIRYDVFTEIESPHPKVSQRASGWYQTLNGWLLSKPKVKLFNRHQTPAGGNKCATLVLAQKSGLLIPETSITNQEGQLKQYAAGTAISKPVAGGDFCYTLDELLPRVDFCYGCAPTPAIVQNKLVSPEVRIYVVGSRSFAFEIRSHALDYRVKQDAVIVPLSKVPSEIEPLRVLMSELGMDFGAADFKSDPKTGNLVFLELNSSPMFVRFNQVSKGALCEAMLQELLGH